MNELPKGWVECQLEDILIALEAGSRPKGGVWSINEGIPSIGGEHLNYNGDFNFSNIRYVPKTFADKMTKGKIKQGDILVVKDGATTGKTAFVNQNFPFEESVVNEHVFICRSSKVIDPKFVFRFLTSKDGQTNIVSNFQGSAQGGINTKFVSNTIVPIAPLNEQKRIVEKLDKLLAKVEEAKARLEKIPVVIKRFRQSVLQAAVTGELTKDWREKEGIVEEWKEKSLRESCIKFTYGSSKKSDVKGKVPVLRMGNIQDGKIVWNDLKYSSDRDEIIKYSLKNGDVLFNRTNSPELVGKTAIYKGEQRAIYAGYLIKVTTGENLNPEFLNLCLNSVQAQEWCSQVKTDGVSQSNINAQKLAEFVILTPPLEEQKEIVKQVEALFKKADEIEERYKKAKAFVDKLTQSILAKAFRGELVPQDPNDPPASKLLKKIKLEKEKLNLNKKQKKKSAGR